MTLGGGGATITFPSGASHELCSGTRAELCALNAALDADDEAPTAPITNCTDSQAALKMLEGENDTKNESTLRREAEKQTKSQLNQVPNYQLSLAIH